MAKKDLVRLLVRLFGDPGALAKLQKNPAKALSAAKLSPAERELLLSGDEAKIRAYLGSESAKANIKSKTGLANIKSKTGTANIKTKTGTANIKTKTGTVNIKTKTATANIKSKTALANIKTKTAAIKTKEGKGDTPPTLGAANIKSKFKK